MEHFTPCRQSTVINAESIDPEGMSANLFKNIPLPVPPDEKLQAFLRIRPVDGMNERRPFVVTHNTLITAPPEGSKAFKNLKDGSSGSKKFTFNYIFDEDVDQEAFYEKCALPLTVRLLKGESSLLFAYGTTNSGKSFTMRGTASQPGIIPRALNTIFSCIGDRIDQSPTFRLSRFAEAEPLTPDEVEIELMVRKFICSNSRPRQNSISSFRNLSLSKDSTTEVLEESSLNHPAKSEVRFSVWVSFLEFYMDNMNDLLAVEMEDRKNSQLLLIQDLNNNYFVKGLRHVSVATADEAYYALLYGWENLHRASTSLNKDSSRSHCIFTITLIGHEDLGSHKRLHQLSNLSFCDLAGSERGDRTQNRGDRLKEAGKINNSLSTLGRCVSALRHNQRKKTKMVVPFRDSPLTKYFQSYFNGTGVASMIININPSVEYFDETLITLQFSAEASDVTVSNEEARSRLKESFTRLTQQWIQSNHRWSSFAKLKCDPQFMSTVLCPEGEEEEEMDADETDITAEDLEKLQTSILEAKDPETLLSLLNQIDRLTESLKASENEKFELELKIRKEVNEEIKKLEQDFSNERAQERAKQREAEQRFKEQAKEMKRLFSQQQQHLQLILDNKVVPDDACEIVRKVCQEIRAMQQTLIDQQNRHEEERDRQEKEISRLSAENERLEKLIQLQSVSESERLESGTNTSFIAVSDVSCGTSPANLAHSSTITEQVELRDQSTTVKAEVCDTGIQCDITTCRYIMPAAGHESRSPKQPEEKSSLNETSVAPAAAPVGKRKGTVKSTGTATTVSAAASTCSVRGPAGAQVLASSANSSSCETGDDDADCEADRSLQIGIQVKGKKRKQEPEAPYLQAIRQKNDAASAVKQRRKDSSSDDSFSDELSSICSSTRKHKKVTKKKVASLRKKITTDNNCLSVSPIPQEEQQEELQTTRKLRSRRLAPNTGAAKKKLFSYNK